MSTISSGIGLVSGLNIQSIVDNLIAVQGKPIDLIKTRLSTISQTRTALLGLSAQLLAARTAASRFKSSTAFTASKAASSNEQTLLATAGSTTAAGQYSFLVRSLASSSQVISTGFASSDSTPVGAGTLTIETAGALVNRSTSLRALNGGTGVPAGRIRLTDRTGASAEIDLTGATTLRDVTTAINSQTTANVTASIDGDRLVLNDHSAGTGSLSVVEVGVGRTAAALGILGSSTTGVLNGQDLVRISEQSALADLNDGNGIRVSNGSADFRVHFADGTSLDVSLAERLTDATPLAQLNSGGGIPAGTIKITNRAGQTANVTVAANSTVGDFKAAVAAANIGVAITVQGNKLVATDTSVAQSTSTSVLKIEDVNGGATAAALGLTNASSSSVITGSPVYRIQTVGDVLRAINQNPGNGGRVTASVSADGKGIVLTGNTPGAELTGVEALAGSKTAADLGIETTGATGTITSRRLIAGLDTVFLRTLRGGQGVERGQITVRDRAGNSANVDLSNAQTLADVIKAVNQAGIGVRAAVTGNGLGIEIRDTSGGTGNLSIADVTGHTARDLGIQGDAAANKIGGANLQRQYVNEATRLDKYRDGAGVPPGKFRITDSSGATSVVDLTQGNETTLQAVIDEINSRPIDVTASINATGDGILLTDTAGGVGHLKVTEEGGGNTARALGILGEADGSNTIDGSLETRITVAAGDTLQSVVDKIRATRAPVNASVINDATGLNSYRLSLTSTISGRTGELAVDGGTTGLGFDTLVTARDAAVIFGSADTATPIVLTSSTNTIANAVDGLKLDLISASSTPVTVSVSRSSADVVKDIGTFVTAYNTAVGTLQQATSFDATAQTRGILLGDSVANRIRDRLTAIALASAPATGSAINRLSAVGITLGSGGTLVFDQDKFQRAYDQDPNAVNKIFTDTNKGFVAVVEKNIDELTQTDTGAISLRDEALQGTADLLTKRATDLQSLLDKQRERLTAQFNATEAALARLQQQQNALSALSSISSSSSASSALPGL